VSIVQSPARGEQVDKDVVDLDRLRLREIRLVRRLANWVDQGCAVVGPRAVEEQLSFFDTSANDLRWRGPIRERLVGTIAITGDPVLDPPGAPQTPSVVLEKTTPRRTALRSM